MSFGISFVVDDLIASSVLSYSMLILLSILVFACSLLSSSESTEALAIFGTGSVFVLAPDLLVATTRTFLGLGGFTGAFAAALVVGLVTAAKYDALQ